MLQTQSFNALKRSSSPGSPIFLGFDRNRGSLPHQTLEYKYQKNLEAGNNSSIAKSWICGPRHEIQQIQIPGYTGYIPNVSSESYFGRCYSVCAAKSREGKIRE